MPQEKHARTYLEEQTLGLGLDSLTVEQTYHASHVF